MYWARAASRRLDGGQQQGDQDGDDGDDDQELDQRETAPQGCPGQTGLGHRRTLSVSKKGGKKRRSRDRGVGPDSSLDVPKATCIFEKMS